MEPTTPQIDSSELIAQHQSDNRPRPGKPGYSPNANYSGKSRHKPNIPSAHNTKPYDIVHEVPVPREEVSVQMPNSIYDSLGYFKLKDNCLQNTLNQVIPGFEFSRDPVNAQAFPFTATKIQVLKDFCNATVAMQMFNTLKPLYKSLFPQIERLFSLFTDIRVPPFFNDVTQLFGDVLVQREQRVELFGSLFQVFSIAQTGYFNRFNSAIVDCMNQVASQVKQMTLSHEEKIVNGDQKFYIPSNQAITAFPNVFSRFSQLQRAQLRLNQGDQPTQQLVENLDFTHDLNVTVATTLESINLAITNYVVHFKSFGFQKTEQLQFTKAGKGAQLVTIDREVVKSEFALQPADYAVAQALDLTDSVRTTVLYRERFSQAPSEVRDTIISKARLGS